MAELDKIVNVGTDVAALFIYHPSDLVHRLGDPSDWFAHDFALAKEFSEGRLVAFGTGSDGRFNVRFTTGALTSREQEYAVASRDFRLRVRQGRLFLDGGNELPYADRPGRAEADIDGWIDLEPGDYRVSVHALAWYDEPGATDETGRVTASGLTAYVARFQRVDDIAGVPFPSGLPDLDPSRASPDEVRYSAASLESPVPPPDLPGGEYVLFVRPRIVFPRLALKLPLGETEYEWLGARLGTRFQVVIALDDKPGTVGTLFDISSYGGDFSPVLMAEVGLVMTGSGSLRVRIVESFFQEAPMTRVEVYEVPSVPASPGAIERLQALFADYIHRDTSYQERIPYSRFYSERVASLQDACDLGWAIAHALDLPPATQYELLQSTEAALVERLVELLVD